MRHAREDYSRIQDPEGKIPENEPVMLFRAQDELFQEVCVFYAAKLLEKYGARKAKMANVVLQHAILAKYWPQKKEPDL